MRLPLDNLASCYSKQNRVYGIGIIYLLYNSISPVRRALLVITSYIWVVSRASSRGLCSHLAMITRYDYSLLLFWSGIFHKHSFVFVHQQPFF